MEFRELLLLVTFMFMDELLARLNVWSKLCSSIEAEAKRVDNLELLASNNMKANEELSWNQNSFFDTPRDWWLFSSLC